MKIKAIFLLTFFYLTFNIRANSNDYYIWHWQMRHQLDDESQRELEAIPIKGMFYRVGHFELKNGQPYVSRIKKDQNFIKDFQKMAFSEIHLVYTYENSSKQGFVRGFLNSANGVSYVARQMVEDYYFYKVLNPRVSGIQIDLEGIVDFKIFLDLILEVKKLAKDAIISITPMSSWYKRADFLKIIPHIDFAVPMFYDFHRGKKVDDPLKVTDLSWLKKITQEWDKLGVKIINGLPTYSYCVLYDDNGISAVPWAVTNPETISNDFNWDFISDKPQATERVILFRANKDFKFQRQPFLKNSSMKYNFISSDSLASYIEAVNSNKLKNSLGIAFFRLGYLNEPLVLDAKRIRRAITKKSKSFLKVEIKYYQLNEQEFYLSLSNLGDPTFFTGEGLRLTLNSDSILGNSSDFDRFEALDEEKSVLIEDYFDVNETIFSPRLNNNKQTIELKIHLLDGQMKTFKLDLNKVKNQGLLLTM